MAKGFSTKGGRIVQFIRQDNNPNVFDPTGKRTVCSNFEQYTYDDGTEYDRIKRQGGKALFANVPLEGMQVGTAKGPLCYNLIDDQVLPYMIGLPYADGPLASNAAVRETEYRRPQFNRADRPFFNVQEGKPDACELGCFGLFSSFKFSSKRGNKGTARFDLNFVTQIAVVFGAMTGSVAGNAKWTLSGVNASGALVVSYLPPGASLAVQVTILPTDTALGIKAKFEAAASGITVNVVGSFTTTSEVQTVVTGVGYAGGVVTVGVVNPLTGQAGTFNITPGDSLTTISTNASAAFNAAGSVTAGGTSTAAIPAGKVNVAIAGSGVAYNGTGGTNAALAFDGDPTTVATVQASGYVGWVFGTATVINAVRMSKNTDSPIGTSFNAKLYGSALGDFSDAVLLADYTAAAGNVTLASDTIRTFASTTAYKGYRLQNIEGAQITLKSLEFMNDGAATPGALNLALTFVGTLAGVNIAQMTTPTAGVTLATPTQGSVNGAPTVEFAAPAQTPMAIAKVSGDAGYTLQMAQFGSNGNILASILDPMPVMPAHILLYRSDTLAGLDDPTNTANSNPAALVGKITDWEYALSKIAAPQSHHIPVVDPSRPNLLPTYDSFAEEDTEDVSVVNTMTLDCDDSGDVTALLANGQPGTNRYISKPSYWRVEMVCPIAPYRIRMEFWGSIGAAIPRKFNGNVEQRTFVFDLIENRDQPWALRWITRRPVGS